MPTHLAEPAEAPAPVPPLARTGDSPHEPSVRPWELELLISGAVTFALLQLPARLDRWYARVDPRMDGVADMATYAAYYVGSLVVYALVGSFTLHLMGRAYWVGLIGLETVFPRGARWDAARYGPVVREVYRERLGGLQVVIDRTDRFCSVIFSAAFTLVMFMAYGVLAVGVVTILAWAATALFLGGRYFTEAYFAAVVLFTIPSIVITYLDRRYGSRLAPGSRAQRWLGRGARFLYYYSGVPFFGQVWMILHTNLSRRVFYTAFYLVFTLLVGTFVVKFLVLRHGLVRMDGYAALPAAGGSTLSAGHYDNLRPADEEPSTAPSIQADVVEGPYVKLFIPYLPGRMNELLRERCPGLPPRTAALRIASPGRDSLGAAEQQQVVSCLSALQPVRLNGQEIRPSFRFYRHPASGLRGRVAYIPTAGLPVGENVLEVAAPPRPRSDRRPPRPAHRIPFWR